MTFMIFHIYWKCHLTFPYFSIYWNMTVMFPYVFSNNHPICRTHIFQRGCSTSNQYRVIIYLQWFQRSFPNHRKKNRTRRHGLNDSQNSTTVATLAPAKMFPSSPWSQLTPNRKLDVVNVMSSHNICVDITDFLQTHVYGFPLYHGLPWFPKVFATHFLFFITDFSKDFCVFPWCSKIFHGFAVTF